MEKRRKQRWGSPDSNTTGEELTTHSRRCISCEPGINSDDHQLTNE